MKRTQLRRLTVLLVSGALAVAATGCASAKATDTSPDKKVDAPGVSADTITLGIIADLTGPFASTGVPTVEGAQLFWADHKVCERSVELVVKDTAYKTDRAKAAYSEMHNDVLAIQASTATPITVVNMEDFATDNMLVIAVPSPALAGNDNILLAGTLNDVEMMNAVSFAVSDLGIVSGDTVGAIYLNNDFGKGSLAGVQQAADAAGLKVVAQPAEVTDKDMTAQITALAGAGVKAVFVAGSAGVLNSAVTIAKAQGLDVPFVSSAGAFDASALKTSAESGLVSNTYLVAYVAPFSDKAEGPTTARKAFEKAGTDITPSHWLNLGYGMASIMEKTLSEACAKDDLSREGLLKAVAQLDEFDTEGAMIPLAFSRNSPGVASFVLRPDAAATGGLSVFAKPFVGNLTSKIVGLPAK